jgi:hypothetical protein
MRFLMRWAFRLTVLAVVLVVALVLLKDLLLRELLEAHIQRQTGLETRVGRFELGLLSPTFTVQDLRIFNPPEFGNSLFLHVADFHVEYDPAAFSQRSLRFRAVRVDVPEATVVEGRSGQTNLEAIQRRLQRRPTASPPPGDWTFDGVDVLNLSLGRLKHIDLRTPGSVETYNLALENETFTGLRNQGDVLLALGRVAVKLGLRFLTNQNFGLPDPTRQGPPGGPAGRPAPGAVLPPPGSLAPRSR